MEEGSRTSLNLAIRLGYDALDEISKPWEGRNRTRRQDRRWATAWSPEQISARRRVDYRDHPSICISHEAF